MPASPPTIDAPDVCAALEQRIDRAVRERRPGTELAGEIAHFSIPDTSDYLVTPEHFGNEGWYWPWNRAGFGYLQASRASDAAAVFIGAYLASLRIQHSGQYRIHKGMPLCNISYSQLVAGSPDDAWVPALLGMIEDGLTHGDPTATPSFQNLIASGFPEPVARELGEGFLFWRREGLSPLYPETILDCSQRSNVLISLSLVAEMQAVAIGFAPDSVGRSLSALSKVWGRFRALRTRMTNGRTAEHERPTRAVLSAGGPASSPGGIRSDSNSGSLCSRKAWQQHPSSPPVNPAATGRER